MQAARPQRTHGALEDPQRCHDVSTARCLKRCVDAKLRRLFQHVQNKRRRMAFYAIAQRLNSVFTELLATAQHARWRSATFERCGNAVWTPLWCDRAFVLSYRNIVHD